MKESLDVTSAQERPSAGEKLTSSLVCIGPYAQLSGVALAPRGGDVPLPVHLGKGHM